MTSADTQYDLVPYPSGLFPETLPDHLAAIARLHGLDAPDPATARVLDVAGGDGFNVIAMAAAYPDAHFHSFDISSEAVARGAALAEAAGLSNIRLEVADLLEAAETMEGPYDYIIAHGLYAWVPEAIQAATLKLIGRVLAPDGIVFLSYNALPGGHLRLAVREMLLHHVDHIADPVKRIQEARRVLAEFAAPRENDRLVVAAMRQVAEPMLRKQAGVLYHDELTGAYAPQSLQQVVTAAAAHGLAFLNDAVPSMVYDGMPGRDMDDAEVVRIAQADDYLAVSFFHQTLLVRPGRSPSRKIDPANVGKLYASSLAKRTGETSFLIGRESVEVDEPWLADFLGVLGDAWPERYPLTQFADSEERCAVLLKLYQRVILDIHTQ
ncbi:MAG: methyltransferase domain-containing protein, partial [Sphingomonas sp.]